LMQARTSLVPARAWWMARSSSRISSIPKSSTGRAGRMPFVASRLSSRWRPSEESRAISAWAARQELLTVRDFLHLRSRSRIGALLVQRQAPCRLAKRLRRLPVPYLPWRRNGAEQQRLSWAHLRQSHLWKPIIRNHRAAKIKARVAGPICGRMLPSIRGNRLPRTPGRASALFARRSEPCAAKLAIERTLVAPCRRLVTLDRCAHIGLSLPRLVWFRLIEKSKEVGLSKRWSRCSSRSRISGATWVRFAPKAARPAAKLYSKNAGAPQAEPSEAHVWNHSEMHRVVLEKCQASN